MGMPPSKSASLGALPAEIVDQIAHDLTPQHLWQLMQVSTGLYRQIRPYLYQSVHYIRGVSLDPEVFPLAPDYVRIYDCLESTRVFQPDKLVRTLTECPTLLSRVSRAGIAILEKDENQSALGEIIRALSAANLTLSHFHLAFGDFEHYKYALESRVTSLEMACGDAYEAFATSTQRGDILYSLFSIPTLRHLCLRDVRSWNSFRPQEDPDAARRARTSNVVSLTLPNTVPSGHDLYEILTWPKALRCLHHFNEACEGEDWFNPDSWHCPRASPAKFLRGVMSQRASLEELAYNNVEDRSGSDWSTFPVGSLRQFTRLKRLSTAEDCLLSMFYVAQGVLHSNLPPTLEELVLESDQEYRPKEDVEKLRECIGGIATYKETFVPHLRRLTLWHWPDYKFDPTVVEEELGFGPILEKAGIEFKFIVRDECSMKESSLLLAGGSLAFDENPRSLKKWFLSEESLA